MGHRAGPVLALAAAVGLVLAGCSAVAGPELSASARTWCVEHQLPDPDGAPSVAASARRLGIASPEVEKALHDLDGIYAEAAPLIQATVTAEATGDAAAIEKARTAYLAWQTETAFPAQRAVAQAMGTWSTTPEWAEACTDAFGRAGTAPSTTPSPSPATPTPEPTAAPTPTAEPEPTPELAVDNTINYTSRTSVGRLVELTITVNNPGPLKAGKVSLQVEGVGYALKSRTPMVGCAPDCRTSTGAEGITYVEWTAPAPGKSRSYTVQLKPSRAGTYEIEVRAYRGPAGDTIDDLASWTVKTVVR